MSNMRRDAMENRGHPLDVDEGVLRIRLEVLEAPTTAENIGCSKPQREIVRRVRRHGSDNRRSKAAWSLGRAGSANEETYLAQTRTPTKSDVCEFMSTRSVRDKSVEAAIPVLAATVAISIDLGKIG